MHENDAPRFAAEMVQLCATFLKEAEPALIDAYFMALEDLNVDDVVVACREAARSCEFFPRPVNLRRIAGETPPAELAADAWARVMQLARNSGAAAHPDPLAEEAVAKLGGWRRIGLMPQDKLDFIRREFVDLYQSAHRREKRDSQMLGSGDRRRLTE